MGVPPSREEEVSSMERRYRWYVGIDWATEKHYVSIVDGEGRLVGGRELEHTGSSVHAFAQELMELSEGHPEVVAVGIETPRGAVVELLVERGFHVYAINPKQLDRFRDRHTVAGAKDDRLDSMVIGTSLRTDLPLYRLVRLDDPLIVQIREVSRAWDDLKAELGRLSNQLRELVYRLIPQLLTLSSGADEPWLWDLLEHLVKGIAPERIRRTQVQLILQGNRIRRFDADSLLALLRQPAPWTTPGTQEAVRAHIGLLLPRLRTTLEQTRECDRQVTGLLEKLAGRKDAAEGEIREHRDVEILLSLPGAGKVVAATMLAEASQPLADRDYHSIKTNSGIAPVTKKSGKRMKVVHMRYACNARLRDAFHYWAQSAVKLDPVAKARYSAHRKAGQSHGRALRSVADRLLRVLFAMLRARTLYDGELATKRFSAVPT
jgi:transposase